MYSLNYEGLRTDLANMVFGTDLHGNNYTGSDITNTEIDAALLKLRDNESEVISLLYDDNCQLTLEEAGKKLNLSREHVRQIKAKTLRKLKISLKLEERFMNLALS